MIIKPFELNRLSIELFSAGFDTELSLPFVGAGISAGFPSPALDFEDLTIDLNRDLIKHPSSTFYGRVRGFSMKKAGISDGDILVIDKGLEPVNGKIAVCYLDGEFTLKRIKKTREQLMLMPENDDYEPIPITAENEFMVWGVVTYVIKAF